MDTAVEPRGTVTYDNPFTGQTVTGYGVPESLGTAAWWSDGPQPGSGQMAVVLGHQQSGGEAVFNRLHELRPGDQVLLRDGGGAVLTLEVLGEPLTGLDKATSALSDALNGHPGRCRRRPRDVWRRVRRRGGDQHDEHRRLRDRGRRLTRVTRCAAPAPSAGPRR